MKKSNKKNLKVSKKVGIQKEKKREVVHVKKPILIICLKFLFLSAIILAGLAFSDYMGFFKPNNTNNHTLRKWEAYYDFTENNDIDILLVGNSHLYTGINPKNLSTALGCNAFILASPGTHVDDHYYVIKEAIKVKKPKLVVLETYGLKEVYPREKHKGSLSDQFKSFAARKNLATKLISTPYLFAVENYGYAWSNTLRNHKFLYTNYDQIQNNLDKVNKPKGDADKLYLGRYVRFQTGIEDSTLLKYKSLGAPVKGKDYETNELQKEYIEEIIKLCESHEIELIFMTLPMYKDHISDYDIWKSKLKNTIGKKYSSDDYWLDLQIGEGYKNFDKSSFENTYNANQHMTYNGSLLATYKLIDFIQDQKRIKLTNRKSDKNWIDLFYNDEGYIQNNSPKNDDKDIKVLYSSESEIVKEVLMIKNKEYNTILAKVMPPNEETSKNIRDKKLRVTLVYKNGGANQVSYLDLPLDLFHSSKTSMNFSTNISPLEIIKVNAIKFVN